MKRKKSQESNSKSSSRKSSKALISDKPKTLIDIIDDTKSGIPTKSDLEA